MTGHENCQLWPDCKCEGRCGFDDGADQPLRTWRIVERATWTIIVTGVLVLGYLAFMKATAVV